MAPQPFAIKYRVEPAGVLRWRVASALVALVAWACRVTIKPVLDDRSAVTRRAEVEPNRRIFYRGVEMLDPRD